MRVPPRPPHARTRLAALLLILSLAWLLGGCGGDDGGGSSSSSEDTSESSETEEPTDDSGGAGDAELQTFIAGCKQGIDQQISAGAVPERLREALEAVCDSTTGVEQADIDRVTLETCVVVASGTSNLTPGEARERCEEQVN